MNTTAAKTLANRLTCFIDGLCKTIGTDAPTRGIGAPRAWAAWNRVRLLGDRLITLAERAQVGKIRVVSAPRPAPGPRAPRSSRARCGAAASLPQEFAWLRRLLPETAQYEEILSDLLCDPELAVLVEKAPQTRRVLRPLCHLLGVQAPELLQHRRRAPADAPFQMTVPPTGAGRDASSVVRLAARRPSRLSLPRKIPDVAEMVR
jgi:hypothetical protein